MTAAETRLLFAGSWEITWSEVWRKDALDLVEPAFIRFERTLDADQGEIRMIALQGWLDCRYGERDGRAAVEFSWQGRDDGDDRCGRGGAVLEPSGGLRGRLFIHCGDDLEFTAERSSRTSGVSGRSRKRRRPSMR